MQFVTTDTVNFREPVEVVNSAGAPATGLTHASAITFAYRRPSDAVFVDVPVISGTSTHADGGFRVLADNVYEFCWPDAVIVPGESVLLRYVYDGVAVYDVVSARLPRDVTATQVAAALTEVRLSVQTQLTLTSGINLRVIQGDDYTRAGSLVRIDLDTSGMTDPNINLSAYKFVVCGRNGSNLIAVRMPILGAAGSHYCEFDPASSITETWGTGTYDLLYRIEWAANEFTTLNEEGILRVDPFDIEPADIIDI